MSKRWSAADMPDQAGRHVVITGGAGGIGFEAARIFAAKGADVLIGARDAAKAAQAVAAIRAEHPAASVESRALDLASLASIARFADGVLASEKAVDVLVNCAGVMAIPTREETVDGFEMHFGINHLGHFALTGRLLPALQQSRSARVITVSSQYGRTSKVELSDLQIRQGYAPMNAYGRSKLANILFAIELNHRVGDAPILSIPVHPGTATTGINRHLENPLMGLLALAVQKTIGQPLERVAEPILFAATTERATGESYVAPTCAFEMSGATDFVKLPPAALDAELRAGLWRESERLTGVQYHH